MWKDRDSHIGDCPALYEAPGGYAVQGKRLDASARARLTLGAGEDAVYVPANVIDRLGGPVSDRPGLRAVPGGYIVQGAALDTVTRGQLRDLGADEDAVYVPAGVLGRDPVPA